MFLIGLAFFSALGAFIQTIIGFGAGVAILLYLSAFLDMSQAPTVTVAICLILSLTLVIQFRRSIRIRPIFWPVAIFSVVSLVIVSCIKSFNISVLTIVFGAFLIALAIYNLLFASKVALNDPGLPAMLISSSVSGVFAGLFSIGGPTMAVYFLGICGTGNFYIASLMLCFFITNLIILIGRIANGLLTQPMLPMIAVGIAGALAGQYIGVRVRNQLNTKLLRKLVYIAVGISGLIVIWQQLF